MKYIFEIDYKQLTCSGKPSVEIRCKDCRLGSFDIGSWAWHKELPVAENCSIEERFKTLIDLINKQDFSWLSRIKTQKKLKRILCRCDTSKIDLERELQILRAKQLADPSVKIPQKLIEMVKNKKPDKTKKLWDQLEEMGADVRELVYEGNKVFGFKIVTPIGAYLDYGTAEEIIELVENDMETSQNANCPSCEHPICTYSRGPDGNSQCENCKAVFGSIPQNFAELVLDYVYENFGMNGIYTILANWDNLFYHDYETNFVWLYINKIRMYLTKPQTTPNEIIFKKQSGSINIPILIDKYEDRRKTPTCYQCCYLSDFSDYSNAIAGLDNWHYNYIKICTFPFQEETFFNSFPFEFGYQFEKLKGYRTLPEGIVWNQFFDKFVNNYLLIENCEKKLSAYSEEKKGFIKPICPNFKFNKENDCMEEQGGECKIIGQTNIKFGLSLIK